MAARMLEHGVERATFLAQLERLRSEVIGFAALETLKYVARSGRVSNLQAGVGELLQIKPILELKDGAATVIARVRGRKKSMQEVIDRMHRYFGARPLNVGVLHSNALADAEVLLAQARMVLTIDEAVFSDIGPAIAALAGPGVVALAGCPNDLGI